MRRTLLTPLQCFTWGMHGPITPPCLLTPAAGAMLQPPALEELVPGKELLLLCGICLGPVGGSGAAPSYGWGRIILMVRGALGFWCQPRAAFPRVLCPQWLQHRAGIRPDRGDRLQRGPPHQHHPLQGKDEPGLFCILLLIGDRLLLSPRNSREPVG